MIAVAVFTGLVCFVVGALSGYYAGRIDGFEEGVLYVMDHEIDETDSAGA